MSSHDPSLPTSEVGVPVLEEGHWKDHAVHWDLVGPPLRPNAEDLSVLAATVSRLADELPDRGPKVLVLGVTQEYARFPWPAGTHLVAWERNESMIRHVWPGSRAQTERVLQNDWLDPDESEGGFDLVLGDGVLSQLAFPGDYETLARVLESVTRPGGRWLLRLYARPTSAEPLEGVLEAACSGRLTNISEFKLRLFMALCAAQGEDEVAVADVWHVWSQACERYPTLRDRWPAETRVTIDNYRDSPIRYSFPTVDAQLEALLPAAAIRDIVYPAYPLGGSCPTAILEPYY